MHGGVCGGEDTVVTQSSHSRPRESGGNISRPGHAIERMYFKVREGVLAGDVETRYINTKQNPSDLFTKDVPREVVEVLGPMLTGEAAWPDTPESEDALKAQIADMRLCV